MHNIVHIFIYIAYEFNCARIAESFAMGFSNLGRFQRLSREREKERENVVGLIRNKSKGSMSLTKQRDG